jgi:hypothetical protein
VLLNAIIKPRYTDSIVENPIAVEIRKARINNTESLMIVPSDEIRATFFSFWKSISNPTKNNKNAMPNSDKESINS